MDKHCLNCEEKIMGRSDKKFCTDYCRNAYNNQVNKKDKKIVSEVNHVLWKNRTILKEYNTSGKANIKKQRLLSKGFDFSLFTSIYKTTKGSEYRYCYDQGYLFEEKSDWMLLVEKKEYAN
jgi:hypothetical protein